MPISHPGMVIGGTDLPTGLWGVFLNYPVLAPPGELSELAACVINFKGQRNRDYTGSQAAKLPRKGLVIRQQWAVRQTVFELKTSLVTVQGQLVGNRVGGAGAHSHAAKKSSPSLLRRRFFPAGTNVYRVVGGNFWFPLQVNVLHIVSSFYPILFSMQSAWIFQSCQRGKQPTRPVGRCSPTRLWHEKQDGSLCCSTYAPQRSRSQGFTAVRICTVLMGKCSHRTLSAAISIVAIAIQSKDFGQTCPEFRAASQKEGARCTLHACCLHIMVACNPKLLKAH